MEKILSIKNLCVNFKDKDKEKEILKDVSFELNKGEVLGIVGESGSGKSVTLMTIMGLIGKPPLSNMGGEVIFEGENILKYSKREYRKIRGSKISYIFQEPMTALNPVFTIGDQLVETIRAHRKVSRKEAFEIGVDLLKEVNIPDPQLRMKNYPHELSGGMRQRAMIATALSCNPEIVLADEPTTALDVTVQAQILKLFMDIVRKRGMSVVFITHDLGVIAEISDNVLVMKDGEIVERGSVFDIFEKPEHGYTKMLLSFVSEREA